MIRLTWCPLLIATGVALGACSAKEDGPAPPTATVQVALARTASIEEVLAAFGAVEYAPERAAAVPIEVDALVREVLVVPGSVVHRGQALLRFAPSATSSLEVRKAVEDSTAAEADADRVRRLRERSLATLAEQSAAEATAANARDLRDSLRTRTGDGKEFVVVAPSNGVVDSVPVHPGELVVAGTIVASVGDPALLRVRLGLEPSDLARVHAGQGVTLVAVADARSATGHVVAVERHVDRESHLAAAWIGLPREATLNVGESVRGRIVVATHEHAITVPRSALLYERDEAFVFVRDGDKAKRVVVVPGIDAGAVIELVSGVKAGAAVIVAGNHELEDGMAIHVADGAPPP